MPHLRKLGKAGNYYAYFYDAARTPQQKAVPLKTTRKDVATVRYAELLRDYERGRIDPWGAAANVQPLLLVDAFGRFFAAHGHLKATSVKRYTSALRTTLQNAIPPGILLSAVSPAHLAPIFEDPSVKPATRLFRYRHIRHFFAWAAESGLVGVDPMVKIKPPRAGNQLAEFLTAPQLERLLSCIDADYDIKRREGFARPGEVLWLKDLILVAVNTGFRIGELVALRWSSIDFESGFIYLNNHSDFTTKSGHERAVPLSTDATAVLIRMHDERKGEYVFRGVNGGRLNPEFVSRRFKSYVRLAKLPEGIHFHSLRHTCASWLVQRGTPLAVVQAVLGHSGIQVTQRYSHLAPDVLTAAIRKAFG